jgi:tetratricopeptide (TPR) repeat protein
MQLSHESYRIRWLVLVGVWLFSATTLLFQARLVNKYLEIAGHLGLRGAASVNTPLQQLYPTFAADGQVWTRHAISLLEGDSLRLRYTTIDNAPDGREVHWNSAWAWTIAGAGWIHHLFTGLPLPHAVERATLWLNPTVLLAFIIFFSTWATRRAGAVAGVIVAVTMTCHDRIFEGFFPTYVDHHGLLSVAVFGLTMGAVFMGAGWWQQAPADGGFHLLPNSARSARSAARFSALCGAFGLWVSAASIIPPIAIIGIASVIGMVARGRAARDQGVQFDSETWRVWGRTGAAASVIFYLLEYFPNHLGFRMEPNHPLHALAWLGGGELIAQIGERWLAPREDRWRHPRRLIWPLAAIAGAPIAILIGREHVFTLMDPFLATLHRDYIQEFLPMWKTLRTFNGSAIFQSIILTSIPLLAAIATLTYRRGASSILLWFATIAGVIFTLMAWVQSRWLLNVTGIQISLVLVLVAIWTGNLRTVWRWVAALALLGALFLPNTLYRYIGARSDVAARRVAPKDALGALNRDIAATLRATQPEGDIVLLSSPNGSVGIGYYGRFKTLGTLYWENNDGLQSAASILGARDEREAATLLRAHGVTHIAIVSDENFIAQYYQLLHPRASLEEIKKCFGLRLLIDKQVPQWLQMIPYKVPDDLSSLNVTVMLFKVNFKQNLAEAIYNVALTQISQDALEGADATLTTLLKLAPHLYQPWIKKGDLLLARHDWNAAAEHFMKGISLAPPAERPGLYITIASAFYLQKQHEIAMRFYRTALAENFTPQIASYLAWIMATSENEKLRNGKEALALAERALKADPNSPSFLNVMAAALAENGRFQEAITVADRSIANARVRGENVAVAQFEARLGVLRAGKPIRN